MFALETPQRHWSASEVNREVERHLQAFKHFQTGQVVALSGPSSPSYIFALLALWRLGLTALPLNPKLPVRSALAEFRKVKLAAWIVDLNHPLEHKLKRELASAPFQLVSWKELTETAEASVRAPQATWKLEDLSGAQPLSLILSSGSSGRPKLAQHSWQNHYFSALGAAQNLPLDGARSLLSLPLYHVGGLAIVVRAALAECCLILPENLSLNQAVAQLRPSHFSVVPLQLQRLIRDPEALTALQACQGILLGGSALPLKLLELAAERELPLLTTYGSTEMSSQVTTTSPGEGLEAWLSAGRLLPHRELKIAASGEIWVRGPSLFQGYQTETGLERPLNAEGWWPSRDRGVWLDSGRLRVLGRLDQMFISGGENIQPEEIEAALLRLPQVQQAIVVPRPDPEYGMRPVAFLAMDQVESQKIETQLREYLPKFKLPVAYFELPTSDGLKPSRKKLQDLALMRKLPQF